MTERRDMESFEARLAGRSRTYADAATIRRIDPLAVARMAMSSPGLGSSRTRWRVRSLGGRVSDARWAAVVVAGIVIVAIPAIVRWWPSESSFGQPSAPAGAPTLGPTAQVGGPVPDVLLHAWQRPYAVTPGLDQWASGFLRVSIGRLEVAPEQGVAPSTSTAEAQGVEALVVMATGETSDCTVGDVGTYRWTVEGKGTVLTLTAIGADACAARERTLAGEWVRADLPPSPGGGDARPAGTYKTSTFNPFGEQDASGRLSYTVPEGWEVIDDRQSVFVLHRLATSGPQGQSSSDAIVALIARPRVAADVPDGAACGMFNDAPGVGAGVEDIVAALATRPGVIPTAPVAVTVGGYEGRMLDLSLETSWSGGCLAPEGRVVGLPILHEAGAELGPAVGLGPNQPLRLILLDLADGRTLAVTIGSTGETDPATFGEQVAAAMPVIQSFAFHPTAP